jgi:hypothetical protein
MDDKKKPRSIPDTVPGWVRSDPELLKEWLSIDWDAEAKLFDALGGRENQAVIGGVRRKPSWVSPEKPR